MSSNLRSCCQPASSPSKYSLNGLKSCTPSSPVMNRCIRSTNLRRLRDFLGITNNSSNRVPPIEGFVQQCCTNGYCGTWQHDFHKLFLVKMFGLHLRR